MYENEWENGDRAFTAVEMMDMVHQSLFRKTIAGQKLNVMERSLQKSLLDALLTGANQNESIKINRRLVDEPNLDSSSPRTLDMTMTQISRTSDAISLKRGELLRILRLCKSKANTGDTATQMHYDATTSNIYPLLSPFLRCDDHSAGTYDYWYRDGWRV